MSPDSAVLVVLRESRWHLEIAGPPGIPPLQGECTGPRPDSFATPGSAFDLDGLLLRRTF